LTALNHFTVPRNLSDIVLLASCGIVLLGRSPARQQKTAETICPGGSFVVPFSDCVLHARHGIMPHGHRQGAHLGAGDAP
jgi:hypothetical protein